MHPNVYVILIMEAVFRLYGFKIHPLAYGLQYQQSQGAITLSSSASPSVQVAVNAAVFGTK